MEHVIKKRGCVSLPFIENVYDRDHHYIGHRYNDNVRNTYYYDWIYFYEGLTFIGGNFGMIELSTCFSVVFPEDVQGSLTVNKVINKFKDKLRDCGKPLAVVIRDVKNRRIHYLDTWVINSLII